MYRKMGEYKEDRKERKKIMKEGKKKLDWGNKD